MRTTSPTSARQRIHGAGSLHKDIPWELAKPDTSDEVATMVEGYFAVESYLPDYAAKTMEIVRRSRGRAWFQANWGYEESKHAMAWETWLVTAGKRTSAQMESTLVTSPRSNGICRTTPRAG